MQTRLFEYPVHPFSPTQAVERVRSAVDTGENLHVVTLNPEMIMQAEQDPELSAILKSAGLVIPDGAGVVWALRRQGHNVTRLPGIELSEVLLKEAAENNWPVAFIGAKTEILDQALQNLCRRFPGLNIAFSRDGYFQPDEERAIAEACASASPRLVFIALGVPRQEKWIRQYASLFQGTVFAGIGGSLDVWSGLKRRAPDFFLRTNLEWLWRITSEPWRIRRTYRTLPLFVVKVLLSGTRPGL